MTDTAPVGVKYNPDVLSCLANLSNDEVFTPPDVANRLLDLLPQDLFANPDTKFLDPACKSGIFLREIAKRLLKGLEPQIPDLEERIAHIFKNQLYGIAITELTGLLARRSLYCSKYANNEYSVFKFSTPQGNICYKRMRHKWKNQKCIYCGATKSKYEREDGLETHAYQLIHSPKPEEIFKIKFDVIISNPPYQLSDGGAQASAKPIYHLFVEQAERLNPRYLAMIIPARWYAGGKGLDEFRNKMLDDEHIRELHDFPNTSDCFPGVNIRGGVCYFLWDKEYNNQQELVQVVTHTNKNTQATQRSLKYRDLDIFLRYQQSIPILEKVMSSGQNDMLSEHISPRKPFGIDAEFIKTSKLQNKPDNLKRAVPCYGKGKELSYIEFDEIPSHQDWIGKWKIFAPRANNIGTELNDDNLNVFIGKDEVCTESYLVIGAEMNLTQETATNLISYLQTKFVRFLHSLAKASQDATSKTYRFIPMQDFSKSWTDEELFKMYGFTEGEVAFIEAQIKPMS